MQKAGNRAWPPREDPDCSGFFQDTFVLPWGRSGCLLLVQWDVAPLPLWRWLSPWPAVPTPDLLSAAVSRVQGRATWGTVRSASSDQVWARFSRKLRCHGSGPLPRATHSPSLCPDPLGPTLPLTPRTPSSASPGNCQNSGSKAPPPSTESEAQGLGPEIFFYLSLFFN